MTVVGLIEHAELDHTLPTLTRARRHRLADLLADVHPSADDGRGDGDPVALVIADVAARGPQSPDAVWGATCESLGMSAAAAAAIVTDRRQRHT